MQRITGTLIWYYYVCKREVWLMAHELNPRQDDTFLEIGRILHENVYLRDKKEINTPDMKIDLIKRRDGQLVVGEVKKSSRFELPAKMQLTFYLYKLKKQGIEIKGELLIPKEKKRIEVELTPTLEEELKAAFNEIKEIIKKDRPPEPKRIRWCRNCAYKDFCWA